MIILVTEIRLSYVSSQRCLRVLEALLIAEYINGNSHLVCVFPRRSVPLYSLTCYRLLFSRVAALSRTNQRSVQNKILIKVVRDPDGL